MITNKYPEPTWLDETFGVKKPIIAMVHLQPLPGDPYYDEEGGMEKVIARAKADVLALQEGGVDGLMFSNEYSLPYLTKIEPITIGAMAYVIGRLKDDVIKIPYGVNCLWDPIASLDLAKAVDGKFIREIISGVYASDFGIWNTNAGETARHRHRIGADNVKMLYNIVPEAAQYLTDRPIESIAKTTVFNCKPDGLCVSGATAGSATDPEVLRKAKASAGKTPVFANTGCKKETIEMLLKIADGAVCATTFKVDGKFENPVDEARVKEFMDVVKAFRETL